MMPSSWQGCAQIARPMTAMPMAPMEEFSYWKVLSRQRTQPIKEMTLAEMVLNFRPLMLDSHEKMRMPKPSNAPIAQGHSKPDKSNTVEQMPATIQQRRHMRQILIWYLPRGLRLCRRELYSLMVLTCVNFIGCLFIYYVIMMVGSCFKYNVIMNIFSDSTQFPLPLYPLITILAGLALYSALFLFNLQKIIQKLFSLCSDFPYIESTIIYLALISMPAILLSSISLLLHHNLIGFQISCDIDYIHIILISAFICHVEESRQTPIRGFLFIRDLAVVMCMLSCFVGLCYDGILRLEYGIAATVLYIVYYGFMHIEELLEDGILRLLGIRETNAYNSYFLQTQPRKQANYLKLKNTIEQHKHLIENEIEEYKEMLEKLYSSEDEKQILLNFAKLFLPYKNALEIQENHEIEENINRIEEDWIQAEKKEDPMQEDGEGDVEMDGVEGVEGHESGACLMHNRTMTEDYVLEGEQLPQEESTFDKAVKYIFYPLYFMSTVEGRVRYFLDYLCLFLLCGLMWLISCSSSYFTNITDHKGYGMISVLLALCLSIPSSKYYLRISELKDFDFINIFLQSSILKSAIFAILIIVQYLINPAAQVKGSLGLMISVILNLVTYAIFGAFMIAHKFATLKTNLLFLALLSLISYAVRIITEIICNIAINRSTS